MTIAFKRGEFQSFRATRKIHLGSIEQDVLMDDVVEYDGNTLKLGSSESSQPTLRSAIAAGWFVPISDTTSVYQARPAQVTIKPATSADRDRVPGQAVPMVQDEERDLGTLRKVRDRGDGIVRHGMITESDDSVPVGRIRSPAVSRTELTAQNATSISQEISRIDNAQGAPKGDRVIPTRTASEVSEIGAHAKFIPGDDYADLNDQGHELVATIPRAASTSEAAARAEEARRARLAGLGQTPVEVPATPAPEVASPAALDKIAFLSTVIPGFKWDLTKQWRARVSEALKHRNNPTYLNGILAVETETVVKHVRAALES